MYVFGIRSLFLEYTCNIIFRSVKFVYGGVVVIVW